MKAILNLSLAFLVLTTSAFSFQADNPSSTEVFDAETKVILEITNIRNEDGEIGLGVYTSQENFEYEKEYLNKTFSKSKLENGKLKVELFLPPGTYGIALLDDENGNDEMDFGLMMPKEGFGFSNHYHTGLSKPDFEEFQFKVGNSTEKVEIKVRYM